MLTITEFHGDELKCIKTNNDAKITKGKFYTVTREPDFRSNLDKDKPSCYIVNDDGKEIRVKLNNFEGYGE